MHKVFMYAGGLVSCSVCVPKGMPRVEIEKEVNSINPTGISSQWGISSEAFRDGSENPCACDKDPDRSHYLLHC